MKKPLLITFKVICISLILSLIQSNGFSQDRYLMVLDVQEFHKQDTQLDRSVKEMILNVNFLINHFTPERVIYIRSAVKALSISLKGFSVDTLPAADFDSTLNIVSNNMFTKVEGDAFTSSELIDFLESRKVKEIVLVGLMAEKCMFNTALGGNAGGYDIIIVTEGIIGMTSKKKDRAIRKLKDKGIKIIPIAEAIEAQ